MIFRKITWCVEAEKNLQRTMYYADDTAYIRREVDQGRAILWRVNDDSYMVTRDEYPDLVIVCYEGSRAKQALGAIVAKARLEGFPSVRMHTRHRALVRMISEYQPDVEYVMRVHCGQQIKKFH